MTNVRTVEVTSQATRQLVMTAVNGVFTESPFENTITIQDPVILVNPLGAAWRYSVTFWDGTFRSSLSPAQLAQVTGNLYTFAKQN